MVGLGDCAPLGKRQSLRRHWSGEGTALLRSGMPAPGLPRQAQRALLGSTQSVRAQSDKLLARSSLPKQQLSAFAQHRQALCRRNLWGASNLECAHEQPGAAWVLSHSSQIKMRISAATLQISIMHWVGLVLCRSVWPALQVLRATQQILGSPTRFGPSESEHRFDLWMRCRNAAPSAC